MSDISDTTISFSVSHDKDTLQKFIFENAAVRGELVDISVTWREVLSRHEYPTAVKKLLGEMVAATALLSANLKFNGSIVMQIHGDGPVRLLVVECDADLHLRATAKLAPEFAIAEDATLPQLLNAHGKGRFVITLDPLEKVPGQQPYQGVVPLTGDNVATVIENYMLRSEQLETKLWLAANDTTARGMLLQKLPNHGGTAEQEALTSDQAQESWNHVCALGGTLKEQEMLDTTIDVLIQRLFWEETIRVFDPLHPAFHCTCTRDKVGNMLKMLGRDEVESVLAEHGSVGVNCDFCGLHYEYDAVDCAQLFTASEPVEAMIHPGESKH